MLIGTYFSALSEKRRSAVPKKFLQELGKKLIIAKWYEGCLVLVGMEAWQVLLNKLTGKSEIITAPVRDTDRFILGSAYELDPDDQGRVIIPKNLSEYAGLGEKLVYIGLGNRVEIWDEDKWNEHDKFVSSHAGEFVEELANAK
ncbi:MAG: cell division/cell wall cluster transcriptional repressor MraZ [Candidatus Microgenomates bacterium]|jgi:MraZ protein